MAKSPDKGPVKYRRFHLLFLVGEMERIADKALPEMTPEDARRVAEKLDSLLGKVHRVQEGRAEAPARTAPPP